MPRCKSCNQKFEPKWFNQKYCMINDECIKHFAEQTKLKAWNERKKKVKNDLLTKGDYIKILQQLVNKYVRLRDGNFCISCNKEVKGKIDAGHMYSVGNYPSVRFDERNINSQCIRCNQFNGGSIIEYRENLIKKIGLKEFEDLDKLAHQNRIFDIVEIKELIEHYKNKLKNI